MPAVDLPAASRCGFRTAAPTLCIPCFFAVVVVTRFRKTASTVVDDMPEVEMEVQRLLRRDEDAETTTIQVRGK